MVIHVRRGKAEVSVYDIEGTRKTRPLDERKFRQLKDFTHGASPDLIGQSIRGDGRPVTVAGVAPKRFTGQGAFLLETGIAARLPRMGAMSLTTFGRVALMLALIGVYGVGAYMVARPTREIGIRMALSADRRAALRLFLGEGVILTGVGLALAAFLARLMRGILFEVSPFDPLVFGVASALPAGASLMACWLAARKATRGDPIEALRRR